MNGRKELNLRIKKSDFLVGENEMTLFVFNPLSNKIYSKIYNYENGRSPYGGNCLISPNRGISLLTNFTFTVSNWKINSLPLIYKIKNKDSNNNLVDLTNGEFSTNNFISSNIPVVSEFLLEITDNQGLSSSINCNKVNIKKNKNLTMLEKILSLIYDTPHKLLMVSRSYHKYYG